MSDSERPQFSDIDAWGLTHRGKVPNENQDHFFVGSLTRGVWLEQASIYSGSEEMLHRHRLATLAVVADGVGGTSGGGGQAGGRRVGFFRVRLFP